MSDHLHATIKAVYLNHVHCWVTLIVTYKRERQKDHNLFENKCLVLEILYIITG